MRYFALFFFLFSCNRWRKTVKKHSDGRVLCVLDVLLLVFVLQQNILYLYCFPCLRPDNFTPRPVLQMKTSLLADSGIFTVMFIIMHCCSEIT